MCFLNFSNSVQISKIEVCASARSRSLWSTQDAYNRFVVWSCLRLFVRIFRELAGSGDSSAAFQIDTT